MTCDKKWFVDYCLRMQHFPCILYRGKGRNRKGCVTARNFLYLLYSVILLAHYKELMTVFIARR